ncbi:uncharacterized protein LOC112346644 [Selaginella moellendorffii]|uniref:uncharacterized protein LOC112346644 n=1 Tax=Selaginella moellendorffii TaxID=88036 RepID=UPI000D1CCD0D|nr:uncharacterized protein LOC112346644 [Selaginella moellendorffii]|eukprot:XP_024531872.1 uncharacterized protein LOC112346644 [Selaginella moellendorffii]
MVSILSMTQFLRPALASLSAAAFAGCIGAKHGCKALCSIPEQNQTTLQAAIAAGKGPTLIAFYADHHVVPLPKGHRFPMDKYRATRMILEEDLLLRNLLTTFPAPLATENELCLVHSESYVQRVFSGALNEREQRELGFPWSRELVARSRCSSGGTLAAMHAVMLGLRRAAANIAGGTHHAFPEHGEGFCVFNDISVAAVAALEAYPSRCNLASPVLVIDLDVHQGNGTAQIFENDKRVITFSIQGANNYPWRTRMKSDYDVDLPDKTGDEEYVSILKDWLDKLFQIHSPGLVFFQAGVDALREDSFGRLNLSRQGLLQRNNLVYSSCMQRSVPLVITMGGGYSRPHTVSVQAHADVYRSAALRYGIGTLATD